MHFRRVAQTLPRLSSSMPSCRRTRFVLCTVYSSEFCTVGVPSEQKSRERTKLPQLSPFRCCARNSYTRVTSAQNNRNIRLEFVSLK